MQLIMLVQPSLLTLYSITRLSRCVFLIIWNRHSNSTYKHFNNEAYQAKLYDGTLKKYEDASLKVATSLAYLNSGQNFIFSTALTAMMVLTAQNVLAGGC